MSDAITSEPGAGVAPTGDPVRPSAVLTAAKQPVGSGRVAWIGQFFAVVLIVVGVIGLREAVLAAGWTSGSSWVDTVARRASSGFGHSTWLLPIGILGVLVGIALVVSGLRPRPKKTLALASETGVFLTRRGIQNFVHRCADDVDGVTSVRVEASRRRVVLRVTATDPDSVRPAVEAAVDQGLRALARPPAVVVRARRDGGAA